MASPRPTSIYDTPPDAALEARLDAEAVAWLQSWGKPDELPCPVAKHY